MAEAAVEERTPPKFYCHMCNVQFHNASANFTCPHCSKGFIEELQESADGNNEVVDPDDWEDDDMDLMTALPLHLMEERRPGRTRSDRSGRRTLTRLASSNLRQHVPFENLLQDFIVNLGVGVNWGTTSNMQLFLGNPGDYAWGREGLDAIVTQLLNQMDSTGGYGPPPVSKEVIDALPIVPVSEEQVAMKLQCSVCWEDFQLKEMVRQLPCAHIYHEPCIRPWLELHGTCPICRQNLGNDQANSENNQEPGGANGVFMSPPSLPTPSGWSDSTVDLEERSMETDSTTRYEGYDEEMQEAIDGVPALVQERGSEEEEEQVTLDAEIAVMELENEMGEEQGDYLVEFLDSFSSSEEL